MFYFIPSVYQPNTAATNRWLAYLRYFSEQSIETHVVAFRRNNEGTSIDYLPHIHVCNYWEHFYFEKGFLQYFSLIMYYIHFWLKLKKGDVIYCYEQVDVWKLFLKRGVRVYCEYTENPDVIGLGGKFFHTTKKVFVKKCKKLSGMVVISSSLKDYFVNLGMKNENVHIVNMIVDGTRFDGIKKEDNIEPYVAYCGTVSNNKDGVDELIKAFSLFSKKHPDVKLYVIGKVSSGKETSGNIELIKKLGINDKVVLTGLVQSSSMPQLLKNACILALNRPDNIQAKYGFPTKLGEYLMSANPVVITKVGDIPFFLKDRVSAFLAEPNDTNSFVEKLCEAYENPEKSKKVGLMGKQVAESHFSYTIESEKLAIIMGVI